MTSFQKAKDRIAQGILGLSRSYSGNKRSILRLEAPCPRVNCLDWLCAQAGEVKLYWADRDNFFQIAGIGIADQARGEVIENYAAVFQAISRKLSSGGQSRYYGGMGFYPPEANRGRASKSAKGREWKAFGGYCFLLPRFEIVNRRGKYFFACNIAAQHNGEILIKDCQCALEKISISVASRAASILKIKSISL
ncbi:MAG: hypothetical protein AABZ27_01500, partial [Candidatus Omnitrophota bacterium]